jgi:hypothetical protein
MAKKEIENIKAASTEIGGRGRLADFGGDAEALKAALFDQAVDFLRGIANGGSFFVDEGDTISWMLEIPHDRTLPKRPERRDESDTRRRVTVVHGDGRREEFFMED